MTRTQQYLIILGIILVGLFFLRREIAPTSKTLSSEQKNILCDFEDKKIWGTSPEKGFSLKLSKKHVTQGTRSLEVKYPKWNYPSINTKKLNQQWGDYDFFTFDVFNPQKEQVNFKIRLDDKQKKRTVVSYPLHQGLNTVRVSRSTIAKKIDAANIAFVVLYIHEPKKHYTLYFDNMQLEKSGLRKEIETAERPFSQNGKAIKQTIPHPIPMRKAVQVPRKPVDTKGEIEVALTRLKDVENNEPLLSAGIPFAPGMLHSDKDIVFIDHNGKSLSIATKVLARWPQDQSIRSVLVQFHYQINHIFEYVTMKWGAKRQTADLKIIEPRWQYPEGYIVMPPPMVM